MSANESEKGASKSGHSMPYWANLVGEQASKMQKKERATIGGRMRSRTLKNDGETRLDKPILGEISSSQMKQLSKNLGEDYLTKLTGHLFLKKFDLPRYKKIIFPLSEFKDAFPKAFDEFQAQSALYFPQLINQKTGERSYVLNKTKDETRQYILDFLINKSKKIEDYTLVLSEFWTNDYGGNVIISETGQVMVEIQQGEHTPLTTSQGNISMKANTNQFTGRLEFTTIDTTIDAKLADQLQKTIRRVLNLIPKKLVPSNGGGGRFQRSIIDELGRDCKEILTPGYFEFVLSKKEEKTIENEADEKEFSIFFIDARVNSAGKKYQF
jgi:hypothetical protein